MRPVSLPRVILGGLLAGMLIDAIQYLADSFVFADRWEAAAKLVNALFASPLQITSFTLSTKLILVLLQVAGLVAGILAVRFGCGTAQRRRGALFIPVTAAWVLTYGLLCLLLVLISRRAPDATLALHAAPIVTFGLVSWIACWVGAHFGCWVYRESEAAAQIANA